MQSQFQNPLNLLQELRPFLCVAVLILSQLPLEPACVMKGVGRIKRLELKTDKDEQYHKLFDTQIVQISLFNVNTYQLMQ